MKYEDLKILDELREKGSITEEEFQREKAKILADDNMDDWEEIVDESDAMKEIDETVDEDYLDKK